MSSSPAQSSPTPKRPSYSAVVAMASPAQSQPVAKKPSAVHLPHVTEMPQPTGQLVPANISSASKSGAVSYSQAHLLSSPEGTHRGGRDRNRPATLPMSPRPDAATPLGSIYPAPGSSNPNVYRPPQTRADLQASAKVTKPFAQLATYHSNTKRTSALNKSLAFAAARMDGPPGSGALHSASGNAQGAGHSSTNSGGVMPALPNISFGDNAYGEQQIGSASSAIGSERQSGALGLSDVPQQRVLAATLSVLRSGLASLAQQGQEQNQFDRGHQTFLEFVHRVCPVGGQTSTEYDPLIPSLEVAYRYPMSERDSLTFRLMIGYVQLAEDTEQMLEVGATEFDQVSSTFPAARFLANNRGVPVDQLIRGLAPKFNLDKPYDVRGEKADFNKEPH